MKKFLSICLAFLLCMTCLTACTDEEEIEETNEPEVTETTETEKQEEPEVTVDDTEIDEDGWYYSMEDVAEYLETYETLPDNFITKDEAEDEGWVSKEGNLWDVADGYVIGGDVFSNREGLLPEEDGRIYYECDIDYDGGYRNGERIIFSNDGLIYYTDDHYESFELIYGDPDE